MNCDKIRCHDNEHLPSAINAHEVEMLIELYETTVEVEIKISNVFVI